MLWFDFFDHDCDRVIAGMRSMIDDVVPRLAARGVPVTVAAGGGSGKPIAVPATATHRR
jgi:hypothetical protein